MKEVERALECIRDIQLQIEEKCEQIKTTKERAFRITQVLDDMPKSPNQGISKTETAVLSILLQGHKLTNEIKQLVEARKLAENDLSALMDDTFFNVCMDDNIECMQLILRIIMNNDKLKVKTVTAQRTLSNLNYHGVRFDVMATTADKVYDIEVQRSDEGAIPRRARYNSSMIDTKSLNSGTAYKQLPESYIIFITEEDVLKYGKVIYHIDRVIRENGKIFDDGSHIIYVNGTNRDNTPLGQLMQDFFSTDPNMMNYSLLANRTRFFKEDERGVAIMSPVLQEVYDEGKIDMIIELLKAKQPLELIAKVSKFTIEKIKEIAQKNNIVIEQ